MPSSRDCERHARFAKLDARYTLVFGTRADGPYAFLNTNSYSSSDPGAAGDGVSITFYERK